jgi:alpha-1,2-mannosyltransferase
MRWWPAVRRSTTAQALTVLVLAVGVWTYVATTAERHGFFDLRVYYGAVNYWQHSGGQIYDFLLPNTEYGFTYPPFGAVAMLPMGLVGWHVAIVISVLLTLAATYALIKLLAEPIIRRQGWPRWFAYGLTLVALAGYESVHETVTFGQVNLLLVAMVALDVLLLVRTDHRLAGIGIGLATAIKLTPGIFIVYLLVTRRWRAAGLATATFTGATWLAATLAPDASRVFWTDALWDTSRVGRAAFISNQSLNGLVARLSAPSQPSSLLWIGLVLVVFAIWAVRVRRAVAAGDEISALALTGLLGCLVSPITWVHHLVWTLPAFAVLVDRALDRSVDGRRRRRLGLAAIAVYVVMSSQIVWQFKYHYGGLGVLGSNAYVLVMVALLIGLPVRESARRMRGVPGSRRPTEQDVPDLVELDRRVTAAFEAKDAGLPVDALAPVISTPEPATTATTAAATTVASESPTPALDAKQPE